MEIVIDNSHWNCGVDVSWLIHKGKLKFVACMFFATPIWILRKFAKTENSRAEDEPRWLRTCDLQQKPVLQSTCLLHIYSRIFRCCIQSLLGMVGVVCKLSDSTSGLPLIIIFLELVLALCFYSLIYVFFITYFNCFFTTVYFKSFKDFFRRIDCLIFWKITYIRSESQ